MSLGNNNKNVQAKFLESELFSWGNFFLVTLAKNFVIILVVKQTTYYAKVSNITILWFF